MKCELCKRKVQVNYGDANHIFCNECSSNNKAQQIMIEDKMLADTERTKKDDVDIPLKASITGVIAIVGVICLIWALFYILNQYFDSKLLLITVAGIFIIIIVKQIVKDIYNRKFKSSNLVCQSADKKLNGNFFFGIFFIVISIKTFSLHIGNFKEAYVILMQEQYINSVFQLFNSDFVNSLEACAYKNLSIEQYYTVLTIQNSMGKIFNSLAFCFVGIHYLYFSLHKDAVCKTGILTKGKILKWKRFSSYSWSEYYEAETIKNSKGCYDLELALRNGKLATLILRKKHIQLTLKIPAQDKDKVDKFLQPIL